MIFGSVSFDGNTSGPDQVLQRISQHLTWNDCICENFSYGSFYGVFTTDIRLASIREDVVYVDEVNGILIMVDGCIYNHHEISSQLSCDERSLQIPELIAKAYLHWGVCFTEKLNGDFAICIYHNKEKQILFYTDHFGLRPMAVSGSGANVFFATDPMGLSKALFNKEKIDPDYLLNLFMMAGHDHSLLPHKAISKLRSGHYLNISPGNEESKPYWFPEKIKTDHNLTPAEVMEELDRLLTDAVRIRADRRFTASAHVSGGLDSGIVAALARKEYEGQDLFYGFSWSPDFVKKPDKTDYDERLLIEKICRQNNISPVYCNFDNTDYMAFISDWRHPSELVFEKRTVESAKERGINLIFSGWGGDEFISIADRGIDADLIRNFNWKYLLKKYRPWQLKQFISELKFTAYYLAARKRSSGFKAEKDVYPYIKKALGSNRIPRKERFHHASRRDVHLQLIKLNHLSARAADWYVHGQRNGIEYRYPLLDKRIAEYMLKVPSRCLVAGGVDRIILRRAGKGLLPAEVLANQGKEDPAKSRLFSSISKSSRKQFISEFELFRNNPGLNFMDFELLERHLSEKPANSANGAGDMTVFYYLKKAHEFTEGYYGEKN
jgi:asparagine synthase (glutamine-hydrolysing)